MIPTHLHTYLKNTLKDIGEILQNIDEPIKRACK